MSISGLLLEKEIGYSSDTIISLEQCEYNYAVRLIQPLLQGVNLDDKLRLNKIILLGEEIVHNDLICINLVLRPHIQSYL